MISGKDKMDLTLGEKTLKRISDFRKFIIGLLIFVIIIFVLFFPLLKYESDDSIVLINPITKKTKVVDINKSTSIYYEIKRITSCTTCKIVEGEDVKYAILNPSWGVYEIYPQEKFITILDSGKFGFLSCIKVYFFGGSVIEP